MGPHERIDPAHNGDGHAVHPPASRNGEPVREKPSRDSHGRELPPGRDHVGRIDRDDFRQGIHREQDHWNDRDHDYHWHDWDGWRICHHYDEFGFHWWGFYVGEVYFWTRYYNDNYWWYEPYWHRWVYMHDSQWWWHGDDGFSYVYVDGRYYRYDRNDGGVIMNPDPTPPVDVPPGDPTPEDQNPVVYSLDGTRSIKITGDARDAFLYDLTVADPNSPEAQPRWLAVDVKTAEFTTDGKNGILLTVTNTDGSESTLMFDSNGSPLDQSPAFENAVPTLLQKTGASETLQSLKNGVTW